MYRGQNKGFTSCKVLTAEKEGSSDKNSLSDASEANTELNFVMAKILIKRNLMQDGNKWKVCVQIGSFTCTTYQFMSCRKREACKFTHELNKPV